MAKTPAKPFPPLKGGGCLEIMDDGQVQASDWPAGGASIWVPVGQKPERAAGIPARGAECAQGLGFSSDLTGGEAGMRTTQAGGRARPAGGAQAPAKARLSVAPRLRV